MNNPDWLDEELRSLSDLAAPDPLLSEVMQRVQFRAKQPWWLRWLRAHNDLARHMALGLALTFLVLLPLISLYQPFVWRQPPLVRALGLMVETAQVFLTHFKLLNAPIWIFFSALVAGAYLSCLFAASTVRKLVLSYQ